MENSPKIRVLICGDRNWPDSLFHVVLDKLSSLENVECVIEGEARGADMAGKLAGKCLDLQVIAFPAEWNKYGKAAGPIRNQQMLNEGKPTLVLAFHRDIKGSKGTGDMVYRAKKAGISVEVIEMEY